MCVCVCVCNKRISGRLYIHIIYTPFALLRSLLSPSWPLSFRPFATNTFHSLLFIVYDSKQVPTTTTQAGSPCLVSSGDCQCSGSASGTGSSARVYDSIKNAATPEFQNKVLALGVGNGIDFGFLETMSDQYIDVANFNTANLNEVVETVVNEMTSSLVCRIRDYAVGRPRCACAALQKAR